MVRCVLDLGWTIEATAERFQVDAKTVRKWRGRFLAQGSSGLQDRPSKPRSCPWATSSAKRAQVVDLRARHRFGAARIASQLELAASTVQLILAAEGLGRLDRASVPVRRYQRERPGELVHVDVKKLAAIPEGGGWRFHGRGRDRTKGHSGAGYRYLHSAVDDCTRLAYSEILDDEQTLTAAAFWARAAAFYTDQGIQVQRVITDNGACYRSAHWHRACAASGAVAKKTRPFRPQTNGKVERFHRILLEEWAYIRPWSSEAERAAAYVGFCHFYNHHRSHGSLGWDTPHQALTRFPGDNLPGIHT